MKHAGIFVTGVLSILYIGVILFFRGNDAWALLRAGNLNELGDFLAGLSAPLAFGWLVYGYLLQSKELHLQREDARNWPLHETNSASRPDLLQEQVAGHEASIPRLTLRLESPRIGGTG